MPFYLIFSLIENVLFLYLLETVSSSLLPDGMLLYIIKINWLIKKHVWKIQMYYFIIENIYTLTKFRNYSTLGRE